MLPYLEATLDKFTFRVAPDRRYTSQGVWALPAAAQIRIGLSDYLQQSSGDVAFAEVKPVATHVAAGDEIALIETIKVNLSLLAPVSGVITAVNPALETTPEIINQDPYGAGWLALIAPDAWEREQAALLDAPAYFAQMQAEAAQAMQK